MAKHKYISIDKIFINPNNPRLIKDDKFKKLITMYPGMIKEAKHRGTSFAIQLNL